jgi:hypothetical protein
LSDRYTVISSLMDDPANLLCFMREFHRRKLGKFVLPPIPRAEGGWSMIPLKESFNFFGGKILPKGYSGEAYYHIYHDGSAWYVLNPKNEEEVGPFDNSSAALSEAEALAKGNGLKVISKWPWDEEDVKNLPTEI